MDLQIILIGAAAFVISAILIYLITAFAMKEKTFEEVLEEQRQRQEAEREKLKTEKKTDKDHKKKYRKQGKDKPKEKTEKSASLPTAADSDDGLEQKMVNLEIDPQIIEPVETVGLSVKKQKSKKAKAILVNKDEKPLVSETKQAKELFHKEMIPKDEIELHHLDQQKGKEKPQEQSSKASKKQEKARETERIEKEHSVRVEKHVEAVSIQRTRAVVTETEVKTTRAKGSAIAAAEAPLNGSKLIASVKSANLKDAEVQTLIEILLARQGINTSGAGAASASEWNKKSQKGDPMALLKKQLEEKERALQEGQNLVMSANSRVKEIRQDLSTEKAKFSSLEKRYQEKIGQQNQEIEALHSRMQNTHQQHMHEIEAMKGQIAHLETSGDRNLVQKLQEEKKILTDTLAKSASEKTVSPAELNNLKQQVQIMQKELASNAVKLNASENAKKALEQKVIKYETQIKQNDDGEKEAGIVMKRKLDEVNQELRKSEARNDSLTNDKKKASSDLSKANDALTSAQKEVSTLKSKLQELEQHLSSNDNSKELEAKLQEAERKRLDLEGNLKNLEKQLEDSSKQRSELNTEIERLRQENFVVMEEVRTVRERPAGEGQEAPVGAPNGDVHEKAAESSIHLKEHEKIVSEKVTEITRLSGEMDSQKKKLTVLQEQLDTQKKKNNDLREKNWKAMEALEKAEKSASVKVDSALKTTREESKAVMTEIEVQDKEVLKRLFPDVSVSDKLAHKEWMNQFENNASCYLSNMSSKQSVVVQDTNDLQSVNESLQKQVDEYKKLVMETEHKLGQLEKSVESEEKRWQKELKDAHSQLNTSSSHSKELEQRVTRYESENQEIRKTLSQTEKKLQSVESENKEKSQAASGLAELQERCYHLEVKVGELEDSNAQYEKQIQNYTNVLSVTETKLSDLENQAKSEESKWQGKVEKVQTDLHQSKLEVSSLQDQVKQLRGSTEDLSDLSFAYGIVEKSLPRIIEEMEVKVASLEGQLKASENRCLSLQSDAEEAQTKVVTLQTHLETVKVSSDDLEALRRRIRELDESLEVEKKKTKDLSTNVIKLNGIIKTGQDALKQEQDTVQKLTDQLNTKQSGESGQELKELKALLADKEKQLEREIMANKQLSQQLAASAGNDQGTSV